MKLTIGLVVVISSLFAVAISSAQSIVPQCANHSDTAWHPLVQRDASGNVVCTYGHEHGDDPSTLDNVFGPLPSYLGGSISMPWETDHENENKHTTYKWYVINLPSCMTTGTYSFDKIRIQMHDNSLGWMTRFHSGYFQARGCSKASAAYKPVFEMGGHFDWGSLFVDGDLVPLPGDPLDTTTGRKRMHDSPSSSNKSSVWYGYNDNIDLKLDRSTAGQFISAAMGIIVNDPWGPVDPNNPSADLRYGGDFNASSRKLHNLRFTPLRWMDQKDGVQDNKVNLTGYTNRYGHLVSGCTSVSLDCIPYKIGGMQVGQQHEYRDSEASAPFIEYDIKVNGQSVITHPN